MQTDYNSISRKILVLAGSLLAAVLGIAPAVAQESPRYYGHHMWDGGWWMFLGPLWMILVLAAIIAGVVLLVRWLEPLVRAARAPQAQRRLWTFFASALLAAR